MPSTTPGEPAAPGTAGRTGTGPRRRAVLAGAAGAVIVSGTTAGCTGEGETPEQRRRRIDAARRLRRTAAEESEALLTRYTSTAAVHPALGGLLAPLREAVARHLEAFEDRTHRSSTGGGGKDGGPAGGAAAGDRMAVPRDERRALDALADAERRTAEGRMRALVDAPPETARLLASVAAAGATHALLLTEGGAA